MGAVVSDGSGNCCCLLNGLASVDAHFRRVVWAARLSLAATPLDRLRDLSIQSCSFDSCLLFLILHWSGSAGSAVRLIDHVLLFILVALAFLIAFYLRIGLCL